LGQIERIGGTSAGAITATLLGLGYTLEELKDELKTLNFEEIIMDSDQTVEKMKDLETYWNNFSLCNFLPSIKQMISINYIGKLINDHTGLFTGDNFRKWIHNKIENKLKIENATFNDLQQKIAEGSSNYKYLFLTGSNLSSGKCEIFSHLHTPNMIIADAVRISMSIPILLRPHKCFIKVRNDGIDDIVVDTAKLNSLYVDGGLLNNFPITMFDTTRITDDIETNFINNETLGFRLVSSDLKSKYESLFKELEEKNSDKSTWTYLSMLINFYFASEETNHSVRSKDQERTIYIDDQGISAIKFDLKDIEKQKLIDSGKKGVEDFLQIKKNKTSNILIF